MLKQNFGRLLDAQSFETLENPEEHSLHCLADVPLCFETPFHVLTDPDLFDGATTYGPGWALSDNTMLLEQSRALGDATCTTCTGEGSMAKGLRMEIKGTVVTVDPPVLELTSAEVLESGAMGCAGFAAAVATDGGEEEEEEEEEDIPVEDPTEDEGTTAPAPAPDTASAAVMPGSLFSFVALILAAF